MRHFTQAVERAAKRKCRAEGYVNPNHVTPMGFPLWHRFTPGFAMSSEERAISDQTWLNFILQV